MRFVGTQERVHMENFLRLLPNALPAWQRYGITFAIVLGSFVLRTAIGTHAGRYGFILFIPSIVAAGLVFDFGCGAFATVLAAALANSSLDWSAASASDRVSVTFFFVAVGLGLAFVSASLRSALERAQRAERDKDLLLQEMSHRVKNKFAMISSIIALQSRRATPEVSAALNSVAARVAVISQVHDYLQLSRHAGEVDMVEYLGGLCRSLQETVRSIRPIEVRLNVEPTAMDPKDALAIGLLVNELVTNAFKHAFPNNLAGSVNVALVHTAEHTVLTVSDDGIGCEPDLEGNLGTKLTVLLASQLGGELKREVGNVKGCRTTVAMPSFVVKQGAVPVVVELRPKPIL